MFRPEWEDEFQRSQFQTRTFRAACCIGAMFFTFLFMMQLSAGTDGEGGSDIWFLMTWIPNLICGVMYGIMATLFSLQSCRTACIRNYDVICAVTIVMSYISCVLTYLLVEVRRVMFQNAEFSHIVWGVDYSQHWPRRTCNDTDPAKTWLNPPDQSINSNGCNNLILSGGAYSLYIQLNLLPLIYKLRSSTATWVTIANSAILACSVLSVGTNSWSLFTSISCQLAAGVLGAHLCHRRDGQARRQFAVAKGIRQAAEQSGNLLYTLIPQNVVERLTVHKDGDMLGRTIDHATVMFCSLEPQGKLQAGFSEDIFDLLHNVFSEFDGAVQRHGMFKYQHVGDWYIVACPRAASPFDEEEQQGSYPPEYTTAMVLLADELQSIAGRHSLGPDQMWLKVGLNCGPVAGAVIGTHRSFYCLYGDTINTAARMCKYADADKVHCSAEFAKAAIGVSGAAVGLVSLASRGVHLIKGKGNMETFDAKVQKALPGFADRAEQVRSYAGALRERRLAAASKPAAAHTGPRAWVAAAAGCLYSAVCPSAQEPVRADGLGEESRLWMASPGHGVETARMKFRDPAFERRFLDEQVGAIDC